MKSDSNFNYILSAEKGKSGVFSVFSFLLIFLIYSCSPNDYQNHEQHVLSVIELEIAEKHLWSADSGMYVIGNNGIEYVIM